MYSVITTIVSLALAVQPVLGAIYITSPVASTNGTGGEVLTVQWADDGNKPTLNDIGPCSVDLYTGSVFKQDQLQNLATAVNVGKTSVVTTTVNPTVGEVGRYYFVRFSSLNLKDASSPQYPYQAYSAKFHLNAMTGKFSPSVLADIAADEASASASASGAKASASGSQASASASASPKPTSGALTRNSVPAMGLIVLTALASVLSL